MATRAQIKANRANAKRSTGPKTLAGKLAVRYNRVCHGLAGNYFVTYDEESQAYEALRKDLIEGYAPANGAEIALVEDIAQSFWRIQRGRYLEAETFKINSGGAAPVIAFNIGKHDFERLRRYMASIERGYHRISSHLLDVQKARRDWERQQALSGKPIESPEIHVVQTGRFRPSEPRELSGFEQDLSPSMSPFPEPSLTESEPYPSTT